MAAPHQFFDPFFHPKPTPPSFYDGTPEEIALPIPRDGFLAPSPGPSTDSDLPITGQGTIAVRCKPKDLLQIVVTTNTLGAPALHLDVGSKELLFYYKNTEGTHDIKIDILKNKEACYLASGDSNTTYWLSLDKGNGVLLYGKHYCNKSLALFEAVLKKKNEEGVMVWVDPEKFSWLEDLKNVKVELDRGSINPDKVSVHPLPVVTSLSPFIVSSDQITLLDLEMGNYTVPANLPPACQTLYGNVAGTSIVLNDKEFPDFEKAIERSCTDPNGWCFKKLQAKAIEFGKPKPDMTYLRITLGYNQGDSPGVPYVLEIWPSKHYSPIHDHGNACAVIKVLCGEIEASYYDSLNNPTLIKTAKLQRGQITWLGPQNYQVHKLHNVSDTVCCTIQCYRYEDQDNVHYDGFDYTGDDGNVEVFTPNSDMAFVDFRRQMMEEWKQHS